MSDLAAIQRAQEKLNEVFPSPEADLVRLAKSVAWSPRDPRYTEVRRLVVEIDELMAETRWHLGQAIVLGQQVPEISDAYTDEEDPFGLERGVVSSALLLIRGYIVDPERVLYSNLSQRRRGKPAAGWVFHMMVDDALHRIVAALDRVARVAARVTGVEFGNDKVYFRSGKLAAIHRDSPSAETEALLDLSKSEVWDLLLEIRDGYAHREKQFSPISATAPEDIIEDAEGGRVLVKNHPWSADDLMALANAAYSLLVGAIDPLADLCGRLAPRREDAPAAEESP